MPSSVASTKKTGSRNTALRDTKPLTGWEATKATRLTEDQTSFVLGEAASTGCGSKTARYKTSSTRLGVTSKTTGVEAITQADAFINSKRQNPVAHPISRAHSAYTPNNPRHPRQVRRSGKVLNASLMLRKRTFNIALGPYSSMIPCAGLLSGDGCRAHHRRRGDRDADQGPCYYRCGVRQYALRNIGLYTLAVQICRTLR